MQFTSRIITGGHQTYLALEVTSQSGKITLWTEKSYPQITQKDADYKEGVEKQYDPISAKICAICGRKR